MKKKKNLSKILIMTTLLIPEISRAAEYIVCDNDKKFPFIFAQLTSTFITLIKILVPILLVISGMVSFLKVTFSSNVEDELKKAKTKLKNSIIAAVVIFFIISIVNFAVSLVAGTNNKFMKCINCFMDSDNCTRVTESGDKICPGFMNDQSKYDENCNLITNQNSTNNNGSNTNNNGSNTNNNGSNTNNNGSNTNNNGSTNSGNGIEKIGNAVDDIMGKIHGSLESLIPSSNKSTPNTQTHNIETIDGVTYVDGILIANKTYGLPQTYAPNGLTQVNYDCVEQRCFTTETWNAYQEMYRAAQQEKGFNLFLISGYRSYSNQETIYNNYVSIDGKNKADTYSARPGHSEHQTGMAFDILNATDTFNSTPEAEWLNSNAYKYGFILRYPKGKQDITGYKYESWHFRYVGKELASKLYNSGNWITLEEYFGITSKYSN